MALTTVALTTRNPALVRRWGPAAVIAGGLLIMAFGLTVGAWAISRGWLGVVVVALVVVGAGEGAVIPSGVELIMTSVPPAQAGTAAGVNETLVEAGGAVGVAVLGSTLAAGAGFATPLLVAAAVAVLTAACVSRPWRRRPAG
jgi:DHA2 family multidrug resistance protein-like MFS transporter